MSQCLCSCWLFAFSNIRRCRQFNKKQQQTKGGCDSKDEKEDDDNSTAATSAAVVAAAAAQVKAEEAQKPFISIVDNTECKFKMNSIKIMYVVNSEAYLYKRQALQRAKQVGD